MSKAKTKVETTRDSFTIDLDGPLADAIAKLEELRAECPDATLSLETDYEYGESYARLYVRYTRPKTELELEFDKWVPLFNEYASLSAAKHTFDQMGAEFPKVGRLEELAAELGAWAKCSGFFRIFNGEIVLDRPSFGAIRRDGSWAYKGMMTQMMGEDYAASWN